MKKNHGIGIGLLLLAVVASVWLFYRTTAKPQPLTIGVLQFTAINLPTLEGFKTGMRELGHTDESALHYVFHGPVSVRGQLDGAMQRLMNAKPDLIFASSTPPALTAKKYTKGTGIPVIFTPVNDPVSSGVVLSPSEPEANVTGVRLSASDGRRLQALSEIVPGLRRVFVPYSPGDPSATASLGMLQPAADALGLELVKKEFLSDTDIILDPTYIPEGIDAVLLPREGKVMSRIRDFVTVCNERKLPLSSPRYCQVEQGALMGYGFMGFELGRQAARLAHLALSGVPIRSLPVETSKDYLFINLKTARAIGLDIDDAVLRRSHRIVR